jgi:hypothetical protein
MQVPVSWIAFWKAEGTPVAYDPQNQDGYRRPEMRVIPNTPPYDNPPRVLAGSQAFMLFGGNKVFDAGLLQQVTVSAGDLLCLSGFGHAWSAHQGIGDPSHSRLETEDDRINMNFLVGIDPAGGADPYAPTVVWGTVAHLYDRYQAIPPVRTTAAGTTITVFVRGYTMWRFDHNDLFFDDIRLVRE